MTRGAFIKYLDLYEYYYRMEGNKIVITKENVYFQGDSLPSDVVFRNRGDVSLTSVTSISPGVEFNNLGDIWLDSLETLSSGVKFNNGGDVNLGALTSISPDVVFGNRGSVWLDSLPSIPPGVGFKNEGNIDLSSLMGDWFEDWKGNIEGINPPRLLDKMVSFGLFNKRR